MTSHQRIYAPDECGADGYPFAWHKGEPSIKDNTRALANHRCERCHHYYVPGVTSKGEWSRCDGKCVHMGPLRYRFGSEEWVDYGSWSQNHPVSAILAIDCKAQIQAQWRILTVHHLTGVKHDCRWWNLASLCQRCHLTIQGRVRMEQVYPYEHSEWFKPHAAGYYAAIYLGEELNRDETLARLDELLSLERAC